MSASEMTTQAKREYVEKAWEWSVFWKPDSRIDDLPWTMQVADAKCEYKHEFRGDSEFDCVDDAYAFTKERERQIAEIEEEIAEIDDDLKCYSLVDCQKEIAIYKRILAREQDALQEMRRGIRKEGEI